MLAFVDGLYKVRYNFSNFRMVLMFVTGIRVASHLVYIDKLVQSYRRYEVKTRQIVLIWELDADGTFALGQTGLNTNTIKLGQQLWVKLFIDQLLIDNTEEYVSSTLYI